MSGCQNLEKNDHIVIFFTKNAKNIDMSDISNIGAADLKMIEVPAGKQSADMHIGSYLGFLAGKNGKNCNVVIVSKDSDFDNVIKFWKQETNISASRSGQIKKKVASKPKTSIKQQKTTNKSVIKVDGIQKTKLNQEVMQAVRNAGFEASVANTAAQIAVGVYGNEHMLSEIHNALKERYSNYLEVYEAAKPVLSKFADDTTKKGTSASVTAREKTDTNKAIQQLLSKAGYPNDIISYVASTVVQNLGVKNGKQQTYRTIISKYGQTNGLEIYNHIRKQI